MTDIRTTPRRPAHSALTLPDFMPMTPGCAR
jgi:hypothetical protein